MMIDNMSYNEMLEQTNCHLNGLESEFKRLLIELHFKLIFLFTLKRKKRATAMGLTTTMRTTTSMMMTTTTTMMTKTTTKTTLMTNRLSNIKPNKERGKEKGGRDDENNELEKVV